MSSGHDKTDKRVIRSINEVLKCDTKSSPIRKKVPNRVKMMVRDLEEKKNTDNSPIKPRVMSLRKTKRKMVGKIENGTLPNQPSIKTFLNKD